MFSNLSQNSILYILDLNNNQKILSGPIERVTPPRPKFTTFNPNMEMIVDIIAVVNGERREFKEVPNTSIANFGDFILAENKDSLNSYINAMLQNSKRILESVSEHEKKIQCYEAALIELNPDKKADKEKDAAIQNLQSQVAELKDIILSMTKKETSNTV